MTATPQTCRHCGAKLKKWRVPDEASWDEEFFFVCFNDECGYYKSGWVWMNEQFSQHTSYRYMINPTTGGESPLPVWSDAATREMIIEEDDQ